MKAAELARLGPRKQQNPAASVKAKGMEPTSPAWFNYFLMRICSFRKFTPDNGCPEPLTLVDTHGLVLLLPSRDGDPGVRVPLTPKTGKTGQINQKYRGLPFILQPKTFHWGSNEQTPLWVVLVGQWEQ